MYAGVDQPLLAKDIADVVAFAISRPSYVNLDRIVIRPVAQANSWTVARTGTSDGELPTSPLAD